MTRRKWYTAIVLAVVASFGITLLAAQSAKKAENERAMLFELKQLRTAVQLHLNNNKQLPQDLSAALSSNYNTSHPIEWSFTRNEQGVPVDPFGATYQYNPQTGWVASSTPGYESW